MYNVSVCPSKIVAKTRRGISQNLESLQNLSRKPSDFDNGEVMNNDLISSSFVKTKRSKAGFLLEDLVFSFPDRNTCGPRPVFHTNSKKCSNNKQQEIISPQHEELIRFVSESWSKIFKEYESDGPDESENVSNSSSIMYYQDTEPNAFLQNFKPFDLESWWGKRLFNNITKSVP